MVVSKIDITAVNVLLKKSFLITDENPFITISLKPE
jgi:hypothetical protein